MLTNLELKALVYSSETHFETMQQYHNFFVSLFGNELVSFGYGRVNKNGFYEAMSNMPKIAEVFIETKAYQAMQSVAKQLFSVEHGFIYTNSISHQSIYNKFRVQLDKQLGIYSTFYAVEPCLNYQHNFAWSFRAPLKSISLATWENKILLCFINNRKSIQYVLNQFKKVYAQNIRMKVVPVKLFKSMAEENKIRQTTAEENLFESKWLTKNDLYLKNLDLSNKEASCLHFYLQGMNAREIGEKIFISTRTVEDYIKRIKQKLLVSSRSELYLAMEKVNLWRNTV
jgi:DNA-binding CsgD family transcriptional regulator